MNIEAFRKELGHRIKVRRVTLRLNQKELGDLMGLPQANISQWELGTRAMRIEQAIALSRVLQMPLNELIGEENLTALEIA